MKRTIWIAFVMFCINIYSMEDPSSLWPTPSEELPAQERESYLKLLPQELQKELIQFSTNLEGINTFDELPEKLNEIQQKAVHLKSLSRLIQALNNLWDQLELIKNADYDNALATLQTLSKDKDLEFLFNNLDFNQILISELYYKNPFKAPENITQEIDTLGSLKYLRQLQFIDAAEKGNINAVKDFLDAGVNINAQDDIVVGRTALREAAKNGHKEVVSLLLARGANVNVQDEYGNTALIWAATAGSKDIVKMLITHGADVNVQNENGDTALTLAAEKGQKDIVELLIYAGADINAEDKDGNTAEIIAAFRGDKDVVELLKAWSKMIS